MALVHLAKRPLAQLLDELEGAERVVAKLGALLSAVLVPILPNTIFPNLHIFVRFSHKYV
jgi:hypothetical protein